MAHAVVVRVGADRWEQRAKQAIEDNKPVRLVLVSVPAQQVGDALRRGLQLPTFVTGVEIGAAVILVIALAGFGVLCSVCLYGIHEGYTIKARHVAHGPLPFDDELDLDLRPPAT